MDIVEYIQNINSDKEYQPMLIEIESKSKNFLDSYDLTWETFISYDLLKNLKETDFLHKWFIESFTFFKEANEKDRESIWDIILLVAFTYERIFDDKIEELDTVEQCKNTFRSLAEAFSDTSFLAFDLSTLKDVQHYDVIILSVLIEQYNLTDENETEIIEELIEIYIDSYL